MASKCMTLEKVLTQILASDSDKSNIEIESDDSYDQEEDFQTNINQCFGNFDEEEPVPSNSVFDISDSNPDPLDTAPLDNHEVADLCDAESFIAPNTSAVSESFIFLNFS